MSRFDRPSPLERLLPGPDIDERFATRVRAPAALVLEVAAAYDLQSHPLVRLIFRLRERLMRAHPPPRTPQGLIDELRGLGWGLVLEVPGRLIIGAAACRPWLPDVQFEPLTAGDLASPGEPGKVRIVWSLEAEPLAAGQCRFTVETRAAGTDAAARRSFLRYWRWARFGIVAIRLLLLPAVRREAERRYRREVSPRAP